MNQLLLVPWLLHRRWEPVVCNVRTWIIEGIPRGVELDEDVGELLDDTREIVSSENENAVLLSVGVGEEDQAEDEDNLGKSHLININQRYQSIRVKI